MRKIAVLLLTLMPIWLLGQTSEQANSNTDMVYVGYVDLNNDVVSSSNITLMNVGGLSTTTYNLAYDYSKGNFKLGGFLSTTPVWNYWRYGISAAHEKEIKEVTVNTKVTYFFSNWASSQWTTSPSFIQSFKWKKSKVGYSIYKQDCSWWEFWDGDTYYPTAANTTYHVMAFSTKDYNFLKLIISPEVFGSYTYRTIYDTFGLLEDDPDYLYVDWYNAFNLNVYYGASIRYKVTDVFEVGLKIRSNIDYAPETWDVGYYKEYPLIITLGCNFDL